MTIIFASASPPRRPGFFSTSESSLILGVCVRTIQKWADAGVMPTWRTVGGHRLIPIHAVERLAAERRLQLTAKYRGCKPSNNTKPMTLLCISRDAGMQSVTRAFAAPDPASKVILASSAFDALIAFGQFDPSVVVLDMRLPDVDTFEMARALTRFKPPGDDFTLFAVTDGDTLAPARISDLSEWVTTVVSRRCLDAHLSKLSGRRTQQRASSSSIFHLSKGAAARNVAASAASGDLMPFPR